MMTSKVESKELYELIKEKVEGKREEIVSFTQELIRTKSVNPPGNEEKVAEILIGKLKELGFKLEVIEVEKGRPNIIATIKGTKPGPRFLCYSHMDTVHEWDASKWSTDPFGAEIIDDKIYGRGSCDHKSEIVCLLTAFETLKEVGTEFSGELVFIFDSDEEQGGTMGMRELMKRNKVQADIGLYACTTQISRESKANFPTCGEVNIVHAATGIVTYKFIVSGSTPHPRYLMNLENSSTPGDYSMKLLSKINQLADKVNQHYDERTGHAKIWVNSINTISKVEAARPGAMGVCELVVTRRTSPSEDLDHAEQDLLNLVEELEYENDILVEKELIRKRPATLVPIDSQIVKEVKRAAEIVDGSEPKVTGVPALTGMGWFVNEGQIPMVMFGYGNLDFHHCFDEHIEISDLIKSTQAYAILIKNIVGQ
ncbi:M20 family metallopeptidase [Alkalihalobacillus sp. AL-G]|uniref:M20 family metallopeptidase n=1 Tax=Alkalihalobacillus sp. AL-G TaxID=2926399 RepID=UPI00272C39D4|nr:M20 family metallopeptidase [Alkalihalobacillus sp. AL-G]WLD94401.1 M20 family metallopeptidase [Alkalihalobacillus sp. AL-G]